MKKDNQKKNIILQPPAVVNKNEYERRRKTTEGCLLVGCFVYETNAFDTQASTPISCAMSEKGLLVLIIFEQNFKDTKIERKKLTKRNNNNKKGIN